MTNTAEMAAAVNSRVAYCYLFIAVAAVADYTPAARHAVKLKKSGESLSLTLEPTVDILATVALLGRGDTWWGGDRVAIIGEQVGVSRGGAKSLVDANRFPDGTEW